MEEKKPTLELVSRALDMGEAMLLCGSEVSRVEDTITRILKSYGAVQVDVFTIISFISLTAVFENGITETQIRRVSIKAYSTDFSRLESLNALSRELCAKKPPLSAIGEKLTNLASFPKKAVSKQLYRSFGYLLSGAAFTLFFGGDLKDALSAGLCALWVWLLDLLLKKLDLQRLFHAFLISFLAGAAAYLCVQAGVGSHPGKIMMGVIMVLIPGIAMTNSMRDVLIGDTISGILRLVEAVLIACAVAGGFALSLLLFKRLSPGDGLDALALSVPVQLLTASLGALGFGLLFNIRPKRLPLCALGGCLTWGVYLLCGCFIADSFPCCIIASSFGALYAEVMARLSKAPATTFTILSEIALIPGGSLYLSMYHLVGKRQELAVSYGTHTVLMALAIALGIVLVAALTAALAALKKKPHQSIG